MVQHSLLGTNDGDPMWKKSLLAFMMLCLCGCMSQQPRHVFTESNCVPPCWNGIVPGQTDDNSAQTSLANIPWIDQSSTSNEDKQSSPNEKILSRTLVGGEELIIREKDNQVNSVFLRDVRGDTIADLVGWLGRPEAIYAEHIGPENVSLVIYLFYPSKGAWYIAESKPQPGLPAVDRISGEISVSQAFYTLPGTVQSVLENAEQKPGYINCVLGDLQLWDGYGPIKVNKTCP